MAYWPSTIARVPPQLVESVETKGTSHPQIGALLRWVPRIKQDVLVILISNADFMTIIQ